MADGENVIGEIHNPMSNPVVLSTLFQICPLSDLRRFRLVSKQWYSISLTRCRSDMVVAIGNWRPNPHQLMWNTVSQLYENDWRKLTTKPFQRYRISNQWDSDFWRRCGLSMRTLELNLIGLKNYYNAAEKVIFEETPNLEELTVSHCAFESNWKWIVNRKEVKLQRNLKKLTLSSGIFLFPAFTWSVLFEHFPNIEELVLVDPDTELKIESLLTTLKERKGVTTIKVLNMQRMYVRLPEILVKILELPQIKLESLGYAESPGASNGVLHRAIELHAKTLKRIDIIFKSRICEHVDVKYNFPFVQQTLDSLTELSLEGGSCNDFHFLMQTPNLRVLHITERSTERVIHQSNKILLGNMVFSRIEELHLEFLVIRKDIEDGRKFGLSHDDVEFVANLMPNVNHFKTRLTSKALRVVCDKWKKLRSLNVCLEDLDDSVIVPSGGADPTPSLMDLKYLMELVIIGPGTANLTEISVFKGFLQMTRLHDLSTFLSNDVSDEAKNALRKRFPSWSVANPLISHLQYDLFCGKR